jgi:hypothetical protein
VSTEENFPVVTLHTGATVPESVVRTTGLTLELLERVNPTALYELVRLAKDPCHELFGNTGGGPGRTRASRVRRLTGLDYAGRDPRVAVRGTGG